MKSQKCSEAAQNQEPAGLAAQPFWESCDLDHTVNVSEEIVFCSPYLNYRLLSGFAILKESERRIILFEPL